MESRKSIEYWKKIEPDAASEKRMLDGILADAHQLGRSNRKEFFMNMKSVYKFRPRRIATVAAVVIMVMALSTAALAATGVLGKLFAVPAPFVHPSDIPTPRPQDVSEEEAFGIATVEINRVFSTDVSNYIKNAEYAFSFTQNGIVNLEWLISISNENNSYMCVLDAATGKISLLHFSDLTKAAEDVDSRHSPSSGDNSYNEAAVAAMPIVNSETPIVCARFFRDGSVGTQVVYWIAVSLDNGDDYLIGITKDERTFVGYSYNEGRVDEDLFNQ